MLVPILLLACQSRSPAELVHAALFVRPAPDGSLQGAGELDPPLHPASRWLLEPQRAAELLAGLDALHEPGAAPRDVRERLLLQRDLRAAFDWVHEHEPQGRLAAALARALRDLEASPAELATVRSDPAGLPEGLLEASHGWVRLADELGRSLTPSHDGFHGHRSRFEVLLRVPGGREATLGFLAALRALPDPRMEEAGTRRLRRDLPGLPAGSEVALVRRALAVDARDELVATALVESVELRSFTDTGEQRPAVFRLDRAHPGALRALGPEELTLDAFGTHGEDPFEGDRESWAARRPALRTCVACHGHPASYSLNSFTRVVTGPGTILMVEARERPSALAEADAARLEAEALERARGEGAWRALLERWRSAPR